jgi:hypothetical protein
VASKKSFPDLNKDGKVTKADVLKGRGVEGFSKGGSVRRPAPVEKPSSDDPLMEALEQERRIQEANEGQKKNPTKPKKVERTSTDADSGKFKKIDPKRKEDKAFADGGMVRGCKGIQMTGKGFKGTF